MTTYYGDPTKSAASGTGLSTSQAFNKTDTLTLMSGGTVGAVTLAATDELILNPSDTGVDNASYTYVLTANQTIAPNGATLWVDKEFNHWTSNGNTAVSFNSSSGTTGYYLDVESDFVMRGFEIYRGDTGDYQVSYMYFTNSPAINKSVLVKDCVFKCAARAASYRGSVPMIFNSSFKGEVTFDGCRWDQPNVGTAAANGAFHWNAYVQLTLNFINCLFDFSNVPSGKGHLFTSTANGSYVVINMTGCELKGGDHIDEWYSHVNDASLRLDGLKIDNSQAYAYDRGYSANGPASTKRLLHICGIDGQFGFWKTTNMGDSWWEDGQNYPTYDALLPDNTTPWSIKVLPGEGVSRAAPFIFPGLSSLYTGTAAAKTIKVHLGVENTAFPTVNKDELWMEVAYIDSSGTHRRETTYDITGTVAADTINWSVNPFVYGGNNYDKKVLSLTTSQSVKQNSVITASIHWGLPRSVGSSTEFFFIDPALDIS